jgi:hypothetical protein
MFLHRLVLMFFLIGCASTNGIFAQETVPVQELFAGRNCHIQGKHFQAHWIDAPRQIASIPGWPRHPADSDSNVLSRWDPQKQSRLWISMGVKPTGGYSIHLGRPEAKIENGVATVTVHLQQPPADAFVTQAITSPCLVLKIGKARFHTIQIQDQNGDILARIKKQGI